MTMHKNTFIRVCCLALLVVGLSACSNAKRSLGLERTAPDEFRVISRAPLTVPPDFTLRPPGQAAEAAAIDTTPRDKARDSLLGAKTPVEATTPAEAELLTQAGATKADPNIKAVIDKETAQLVSNKTLLENITSRKTNPTAVIVDPVKEKERLEKNKEEGKAPNEGAVPTIKPRRRGIF